VIAPRTIASVVTLVALGLTLLAPAVRAQEDPRLGGALSAYASALDERERDARLAGFADAERGFSAAIEAGAHNAALYTNLGNAALQAEHPGRAVLAYQRALYLDADSARALQNLEHVRTTLPPWVPTPEPEGAFDSFFLYRSLARDTRSLGGAIAFAIAGLCMALAIRTGQGAWRGIAALCAVAWLGLTGSVWFDAQAQEKPLGVIVVGEALARSADSALAALAFPEPLPGGTEVRVLEVRPPWTRVRLSNGRDAWVSESSVETVVPLN
jgi:hypothetical protein